MAVQYVDGKTGMIGKLPTAASIAAKAAEAAVAYRPTNPGMGAGSSNLPATAYANYSDPSAGGGGTTGPAADTGVADYKITDWSSYLSIFGIPKSLVDQLNSLPKTNNQSLDIQNAIAFIRGTGNDPNSWYANTFPNIGEAMARGVVANEQDYRQKMSQFDQVYQQYYGRSITNTEFGGFIAQGLSADIVNRQIQGDKYVDANRNDIQYLSGAFGQGRLDDNQLKDIGRNQAGLGTTSGQVLQASLEKAMQRAQRVFAGTLAQIGSPNPLQLQDPRQLPDVGR